MNVSLSLAQSSRFLSSKREKLLSCSLSSLIKLLRKMYTNLTIQAKAALDGTKLLGAICKMNIYFSNFANVDLKN